MSHRRSARRIVRPAVAEAIGTAFLLAVVGSGIMGERLAGGNVALALLANTLATGAALVALILTFGPISGAHFNPAVTLADASQGGLPWREVPAYIVAQVAGAFAGVAAAHVMFGEPRLLARPRTCAPGRAGVQRVRRDVRPAVGDLGLRAAPAASRPVRRRRLHPAAYWFTASTSFANPAVTLARAHRHVRRHPARSTCPASSSRSSSAGCRRPRSSAGSSRCAAREQRPSR